MATGSLTVASTEHEVSIALAKSFLQSMDIGFSVDNSQVSDIHIVQDMMTSYGAC